MAQSNLPEVFDTVRGIVGYDNGNVFERSFLFPKKAEKRLEVQKEVILRMMEVNEQTTLARIEAEKEITLAQLKYSHELQELKHETFRQIIQEFREFDSDIIDEDVVSYRVRNIGDVISKL